MNHCCTDENDQVMPCTECGTAGPVVGVETVRPHRPGAADGGWRYCQSTGCPVIFYLDDHNVQDHEVVTQVGSKATTKPKPVCFCFAKTADGLATDLARNNGVSTAKEAIKAAVADGLCSCQHLNPSGQCCLPEIHRTLAAVKLATLTTDVALP